MMHSTSRALLVIYLLLVILNFDFASVFAATPAEIAQQQLLIKQKEQLDAAKRLEEELKAQRDAPSVNLQDKDKYKKIELPEEEISFEIKQIVVECSTTNRFKWTQKLVEQYENRKIGVQGVNLIATMLSDRIVDKGYVTTRVVVPEQDLNSGILRLKIIPGIISNIRFENPKTFGTWRTAFPSRPGQILNVRELEQGLEQMKRVANQDVKMELLPGENQGESEVVITVRRTKFWQVGISVDDANSKITGRMQGSFNISLYNPTGLNDVLTYSYGKDFESNSDKYGTKNYNLSYSIPYGNYTFNVSKYSTKYYQMVPSFVPFKSSSNLDMLEIGVQGLIHRDKTSKTQFSFKILQRERHSYIDNVELIVQQQQTTAYQVGVLRRQYIGQNTIDMSIFYQKGMPWLGAKAGFTDFMDGMPTTRYSFWTMNFNFAAPIKLGKVEARYNLSMRGQYTKDVLYGSEQMSIGGRYTVRGFDGEHSLSAENGYLIRNEISLPLKKIGMEIYAGLDFGRVWGPSDKYLLGKNMAGTVIGIRGNLLSQLQYDFFVGVPIYKPEGFRTSKRTIGMQLYWYF